MIVSKYDKSYDTASGSETQRKDPPRRIEGGGRSAKERWEDDGGPLNDQPPVTARELTIKPGWSVLSLRALNEAIRQQQRDDDPVRLQLEAEDRNRSRLAAIRAEEDEAAASARARRGRYRNAWENT